MIKWNWRWTFNFVIEIWIFLSKKFRRKPVERRNPAEASTEMNRIMDHETNQKEQAKVDAVKGANYECGEVSILPHKSTNKESILDKYLHLEKNKKSFI